MTAISHGNEILSRRCAACHKPIHVGQLYYGDNGGPSVHSPECTADESDTPRQGLDHHA